MKYALLIAAGVLAVPQSAPAQTAVKLDNPCINVFQPDVPFPLEFKIVASPFASAELRAQSEELQKIARSILDIVGITRDINVHHTSEVPNACATIDAQRRRVVYISAVWLDEYVDKQHWSKIGVISHEIGHHLNNHTIEDELGHWLREYEADKFAGRVIKLLGGSAEDAKKTVARQPVNGSSTHPPRSLRIAAILEGYGQASATPEIPSALKTRPEATVPVNQISVTSASPARDDATIVQKQKLSPTANAVRGDVIESQIGYLFSESKDERSFAYSNLLASSRSDVAAVSKMLDYAGREADNARGVINVLSFLKLADKEVLKSLRPKIVGLLDNPKVSDNGPQTRDVIEDVRRLLR
ncbi:M48 family metalloprotease [Bosea sp. Tri-44]|uniref:M48 family metalloprotease n=1 Tax=Bosea sp. Tri-44 TaxID=1972137 RepID=UPI00100E68D6|nr:M48 family metalloprotease [Bosea sp. Tri-44]